MDIETTIIINLLDRISFLREVVEMFSGFVYQEAVDCCVTVRCHFSVCILLRGYLSSLKTIKIISLCIHGLV